MSHYTIQWSYSCPIQTLVSTNTRGRRSRRARRAIRASRQGCPNRAFWLLYREHTVARKAWLDGNLHEGDLVRFTEDELSLYAFPDATEHEIAVNRRILGGLWVVTGFINQHPPRIELDRWPRRGSYTCVDPDEITLALPVRPW